MPKFIRNKIAGAYLKDGQTLSVHGILEDDIYGLELDIDLDLSTLMIKGIKGKWNRMENSQCIRAIPFLKEAVGFSLEDPDLVSKVQKVVGRMACRHFADLLLECCDAAKEAIKCLDVKKDMGQRPGLPVENLFGQKKGTRKDETGGHKKGYSKGTVIDLHVHSYPASPCSSITPEELILEAKRIQLDGICLTDHHYRWDPKETEELGKRYDFLILRGNEITTDQGDILVFGLEEDIKGIIPLAELRQIVISVGGFMIAAHPFRGFLTFGIGYLGLSVKKAMDRPVFRFVDAVEVLNSKVGEQENDFAAKVAQALNLPTTGGSDAHTIAEVGIYATWFPTQIQNEHDLVLALKNGGYLPIRHRSNLDPMRCNIKDTEK